jgi:hypothetical protein
MVTLDEALAAPGRTEDDEKLQLAPVGKFEQLSPTELLKLPPSAETVMLVCAWCPERVLMLAGEAERA